MNQSNHPPVCLACKTAYRVDSNDGIVIDMFNLPQVPRRIIHCDIWKCPGCGHRITYGFAERASEHFEPDFDDELNGLYEQERLGQKIVVLNYEFKHRPIMPAPESTDQCLHQFTEWNWNSHRGGTVTYESRYCGKCGASEYRNEEKHFGYEFWDVMTLKLVFPSDEAKAMFDSLADERARPLLGD